MTLLLENINLLIISVCALIGSAKANNEFNNGKSICSQWLDILIGVVAGVAVVHYYTEQLNLGLMAMLAVLGGASGAMIVEVFLKLLPRLLQDVIKKWVEKFTGKL